MKIITIVSENSLRQNSYIISSGDTTFMIDCGASPESVQEEYLKETGEPLTHLDAIFLTHTHFDHTWAICHFDEVYSPTIFVAKGGKEWISDPSHNASGLFGNPLTYSPKAVVEFQKEEPITIKNLSVIPFFTPGHTDCSVCYKIGEFLFTGDTEFYLAVGRTDMPTGNQQKLRESLEKIHHISCSLHYPGHGIPYK